LWSITKEDAMALDPITAISDLVKIGFKKFLPDKMGEAERTALENQMEMFIMKEARKTDSAFHNFVLDYEGAAKEHGPFIKWLRGVIRPVLTIVISGAYIWGWMRPGTFTTAQVEVLNPAFLIVLAFWFGERAIKNTGIVDMLRKK
jgi:hypothetical protein